MYCDKYIVANVSWQMYCGSGVHVGARAQPSPGELLLFLSLHCTKGWVGLVTQDWAGLQITPRVFFCTKAWFGDQTGKLKFVSDEAASTMNFGAGLF